MAWPKGSRGGWPKKDEGFRAYYERPSKDGNGSYLLVDIPTPEEREQWRNCSRGDYDGIGEVLVDNDPESPNLASTGVSVFFLYKCCRRVSWDELPEVWQNAFREWMNGNPEDYRGLWRMPQLREREKQAKENPDGL